MLGNLVLSSLKLRISGGKTCTNTYFQTFLIQFHVTLAKRRLRQAQPDTWSYLTTNTFSRKASSLPKASGILTI
jgi:hypothetical protein